MKPVICNHGNNEAFVSLIKSPCGPGGTWSTFAWKSKGTDGVCSNTFFFFLESRLWLPSIHLSSEERERHLFRFPAEIQCASFCFQRGAFTAFHLWRGGNHQHKQEVETTWNQTLQWTRMKMMQGRGRFHGRKIKKRDTWNRRGKQMGSSHKCVHVLKSHVPITAPLSLEAFIINGGNHRRLLIGDALVGVSEVSGVLSLSICKLPRLWENRRDVTLSCVPPVDSEGCNLNLSVSSRHSLWLAAMTPGLEHTNSGTAVWESPQLVSGMESKLHNMQMTGSIVLTVNHQKVNRLNLAFLAGMHTTHRL